MNEKNKNKNKNSNEKVSRLPQTEVKTYEQDNDDDMIRSNVFEVSV